MSRPARPYLSAALINAAQAGDAAAISALIAGAQPDVRRYARRTCRNQSDMDDAAQEALIIIYRRIGSLRAIGALSSWMLRVVDRICLRLARQALGQSTELDVLEADERFRTLTDHELRLDLAAAIQSLPPHYREVLLLRDIEELTIDEIGTRLSATRQAVKARLHRGRLLVREYIAR
ncbi:sigma-70 family RNA polymerase sigma factor [Novosphingobium sp.]|uniref:RNA polymerase sigma factor n=1 Tax=Novosphingobium sp. TaxID=1874826 RepID=UPI001D4C8A0A|nr:sigma-70 family RNA polymerase sigma factor [Novosphingobium sp.]MBX9663676.1 sigma-70 family RNA polymerase sigma factor [Novosphingobium sp.]